MAFRRFWVKKPPSFRTTFSGNVLTPIVERVLTRHCSMSPSVAHRRPLRFGLLCGMSRL